MPTTTPSSRSARPGRSPALQRAGVALLLCLLAGCAARQEPAELFQLGPESPAHKAAQTRQFETGSETELLSASAAVLQDLGFQISESVRDVGFLRAVKERSAREYGQEIRRALVALVTSLGMVSGAITLVVPPVDLQQQINAALVTRPISGDVSRHEVRILFYRLVWKGAGSSGGVAIEPGRQKMEVIRDPEIYQQFFARLSKAVFLEAHKL